LPAGPETLIEHILAELDLTYIQVRRNHRTSRLTFACDQCHETVCTIDDADTLASLLATVSDHFTDYPHR
jgi:hypothetical protein